MRDNKIANSSTTTVTDKSLLPQDAQVNVATPNPLEGDELFMERVFGGPAAPVTEHLRARTSDARRETKAEKTGRLLKEKAAKPQHYKIVSISLYMEDIERLNSMVDELKSRGHFKANKSMLIRHALEQLDLDQIPKNR